MIAVCLVVWRRHYKLPELMKQLRDQTYQDFKVWIWNNHARQYVDVRNLSRDKTIVFNSQRGNIGSCARFKIARLSQGTPIIFIDDDLILEKDFIEYYYEQHKKFGKDAILGWFSKTWDEENYHKENKRLPYGSEADYIGTGGMILNREIIDEEGSLQRIPEKYEKAEDLYLSYVARAKYDMKLITIEPKCRIRSDSFDQSKKLIKYKQNAFLSLRKEGWKLLKDNE